MDTFFNHFKAPFTHTYTVDPTRMNEDNKISKPAQLLCVAGGLATVFLVNYRYNLIASAAAGLATFYATAGVARHWKIAAIENRSLNKSNSSNAINHNKPPATKEEAVKLFTYHLTTKDINQDQLNLFLTDAAKQAIANALTEVNNKPANIIGECQESFLKELTSYYQAFVQYQKESSSMNPSSKIQCKSLEGTVTEFAFSDKTTALQIKAQLFTQVGPTYLIFTGKQLENDRTLNSYTIQPNDGILHYVLRKKWAFQLIE